MFWREILCETEKMDDTLLSYSESRLRTIFGKRNRDKSGGDAPETPAGADPLFPSLDAEPPEIVRPEPALRRPSWDPRDRWRQLRPSQPLHAPPESDLPAQFRYEDLSAWEKSETMDTDQDRLLNWLQQRFERSLQFNYNAEISEISADEAVRQQEFTPLQLLDEQLSNLGLSSVDHKLHERRRQLLEGTAPGTTAAGTEAATATASKPSSTWEQEVDDSEFSQFVSPQQQQQQVVVTVHEAEPKPQRRRQKPECGDLASDNTIECDTEVRRPMLFRHQRQHQVAQFGDVPSCGSNSGSGGSGVRKSGRKPRLAEDSV